MSDAAVIQDNFFGNIRKIFDASTKTAKTYASGLLEKYSPIIEKVGNTYNNIRERNISSIKEAYDGVLGRIDSAREAYELKQAERNLLRTHDNDFKNSVKNYALESGLTAQDINQVFYSEDLSDKQKQIYADVQQIKTGHLALYMSDLDSTRKARSSGRPRRRRASGSGLPTGDLPTGPKNDGQDTEKIAIKFIKDNGGYILSDNGEVPDDPKYVQELTRLAEEAERLGVVPYVLDHLQEESKTIAGRFAMYSGFRYAGRSIDLFLEDNQVADAANVVRMYTMPKNSIHVCRVNEAMDKMESQNSTKLKLDMLLTKAEKIDAEKNPEEVRKVIDDVIDLANSLDYSRKENPNLPKSRTLVGTALYYSREIGYNEAEGMLNEILQKLTPREEIYRRLSDYRNKTPLVEALADSADEKAKRQLLAEYDHELGRYAELGDAANALAYCVRIFYLKRDDDETLIF